MKRARDLLLWLIKQDVDTVEGWLDDVWKGVRKVPEDFDWPNLAAAITVRARAANGPDCYSKPDLQWGRLAIAIYQYTMTLVDPLTKLSLENSMMHLKGYLILYYGNIVGDPVLDANRIIEWFFQNLHLSLEEAVKQAANMKNLEIEELLRLRYIKERLSIIRFLSEDKVLEPDEELSKWLAIQQRLP
jgi:hypothetical protein